MANGAKIYVHACLLLHRDNERDDPVHICFTLALDRWSRPTITVAVFTVNRAFVGFMQLLHQQLGFAENVEDIYLLSVLFGAPLQKLAMTFGRVIGYKGFMALDIKICTHRICGSLFSLKEVVLYFRTTMTSNKHPLKKESSV